MYRTLTSLSLRLCKHSRSPSYHNSFVASKRTLATPHLRHPGSWNAQISLHNFTVLAALVSTTGSLPGTAAQMLLGRADAYEGFIVSADDLPTAPEEFDSQLENSLQVCGCTGLTLHTLCYLCCNLVPCTDRIGQHLARKASGSLCQQQNLSSYPLLSSMGLSFTMLKKRISC